MLRARRWMIQPLLDGATTAKLRTAILEGMQTRQQLTDLPRLEEVFNTNTVVQDPLYEKLNRALEARKRKKARSRRRRAKESFVHEDAGAAEEASGEDLYKASLELSRKIEARKQLVGYRDMHLLSAINKARVNVWMTSSDIEVLLRGAIGRHVGEIAKEAAGIEDPILFADKPVLRRPFSQPLSYQAGCAALGVAADAKGCVIGLCCNDLNPDCCELSVLSGAEDAVASSYFKTINPKSFDSSFGPTESHVSFAANVLDLDMTSVHRDASSAKSGDALVMHPHTLFGLGSNYSLGTSVVYLLYVVDRKAAASLLPPTWVSYWRSSVEADLFRDDSLFPRLGSA